MEREIDYSMLPEHMRGPVRDYLEKGWEPGSFLKAILSNDFVSAAGAADAVNASLLYNYAKFLVMEMPSSSWGSRDVVKSWCACGGLVGLADRVGENVS